MPTLDFKCETCGKKFEELVFGSNTEKVCCPECGSKKLSRIYEGKWMFGSQGGGCSGNCATCQGCKH